MSLFIVVISISYTKLVHTYRHTTSKFKTTLNSIHHELIIIFKCDPFYKYYPLFQLYPFSKFDPFFWVYLFFRVTYFLKCDLFSKCYPLLQEWPIFTSVTFLNCNLFFKVWTTFQSLIYFFKCMDQSFQVWPMF